MYEQNTSATPSPTTLRYFRQLKKSWWIPTILLVIFAVAGFLFAQLTYKPTYSSIGSFWLQIYSTNENDQTKLVMSDIQAATGLAQTYQYFLTGADTIDYVLEESGLDLNPSQVKKMVSISQATGSVLELKVTASDPETAYRLAVAYMGAIDIVVNPKDDSSGSGTAFVNSVQKIQPRMPQGPNTDYKKILYPAAGALLGLAVGLFLVWVLTRFSHTIQSEDDVYDFLPVKLFASIPTIGSKSRSRKGNSSLLISPRSDFSYVEAYKSLRVRVESLAAERGYKKFIVTSTLADEGKSTVAANLAIALAQKGKKVLLIDVDLRRPTQHNLFQQATYRNKGLSDILTGSVYPMDAIHHNEKYGVYILYSGKPTDQASELLGNDLMNEFFKIVEPNFDFIIIDTPPAHVVSDAMTIRRFVDATILVVRQDFTPVSTIRHTLEDLDSEETPVIGCVFNGVARPNRLLGYGRYSSYYYDYRESDSSQSQSSNSKKKQRITRNG